MSTETETVGIIRLDGEASWQAFNLNDEAHVRWVIEEVTSIAEGSILPGQVDDDDEPAFVTIEIRVKPAGWVASLPEFDGW